MELEYQGENHKDCISYDQLDRLNYTLYTLLLHVLVAAMAPE